MVPPLNPMLITIDSSRISVERESATPISVPKVHVSVNYKVVGRGRGLSNNAIDNDLNLQCQQQNQNKIKRCLSRQHLEFLYQNYNHHISHPFYYPLLI